MKPGATVPGGTSPWARFGVPVLLLMAGGAALLIDVPVARWFHQEGFPGEIRKFLDRMELFGAGQGLLFIFLTISVLDVANRRRIPRVAAASLGAGLVALGLKLLVVRHRPRSETLLDVDGGFQGNALDTFGEWLPFFGAVRDADAFPSAHTTTAVGLALALTSLYPRGRWLFLAFAVGAGLQRLEARAHYVSDICCGAALGWVLARIVLGDGAVGRLFTRWETRAEAPVGG